jgi:hypothetical protein
MHTAETTTASTLRMPADPPVFYTVQRFCAPRALPRSTFYKLVKDRKIRITKRGARSLIHVDEAKRYDNSLLDGV